MLKLISPLRSTFLPNRGMHDNISIAHKVLFTLDKKLKEMGYMATKLYMEKIMLGLTRIDTLLLLILLESLLTVEQDTISNLRRV